MEWLTKAEAAAHLKVSVRQLSRLKVPRGFVGESPRYAREALDAWLEATVRLPGAPKPRTCNVVVPPIGKGRSRGPTTTADVMARL